MSKEEQWVNIVSNIIYYSGHDRYGYEYIAPIYELSSRGIGYEWLLSNPSNWSIYKRYVFFNMVLRGLRFSTLHLERVVVHNDTVVLGIYDFNRKTVEIGMGIKNMLIPNSAKNITIDEFMYNTHGIDEFKRVSVVDVPEVDDEYGITLSGTLSSFGYNISGGEFIWSGERLVDIYNRNMEISNGKVGYV